MTASNGRRRRLVVAGHREWHEDEPALRDRRVREHTDDVRLLQGDEVPVDHRRGGEDPQHRLPRVGRLEEAERDDAQHGDEATRLRRHRQERGHRRGRALVGVGCPEVERHRAHLEREPAEGEKHRDREQRRGFVVADVTGDLAQQSGTGLAVHQRHAVEHDRGRQHADQEVLDRGLVRPLVVLAPASEHERRDRDRLQRDEDRHEVARRRHHDHAEHRRQQQEVVLALVVVAFADVVG